jgi:hypothetical protein
MDNYQCLFLAIQRQLVFDSNLPALFLPEHRLQKLKENWTEPSVKGEEWSGPRHYHTKTNVKQISY